MNDLDTSLVVTCLLVSDCKKSLIFCRYGYKNSYLTCLISGAISIKIKKHIDGFGKLTGKTYPQMKLKHSQKV